MKRIFTGVFVAFACMSAYAKSDNSVSYPRDVYDMFASYGSSSDRNNDEIQDKIRKKPFLYLKDQVEKLNVSDLKKIKKTHTEWEKLLKYWDELFRYYARYFKYWNDARSDFITARDFIKNLYLKSGHNKKERKAYPAQLKKFIEFINIQSGFGNIKPMIIK